MRSLGLAVGMVLGLGLGLGGCSKGGTGEANADAKANASANANANANANATADAGADGSASAGAKTVKGGKFGGTYAASVGTMYVPADKDWASVRFKNDETKHLGEGEISLEVQEDGRVSGATTGGALGASVLDGRTDGTHVTATIRRKDPADEGLTGTLLAKRTEDAIDGTMKLAEANAAVVREAKVSLKKK